jgi:general nucleoside transport system permease protein
VTPWARFEPRGTPSNAMVLGSPLIALALTVIVGALLFIALGQDPATGLSMFFWQPIRSGYAWSEIAMKAVPLVLIALGLSLCYRANVWNIGAEGQYILGAICAGGVAIQADAGASRGVVIVILAAGVLGGMVWAAVVALLRDRFNANEILVSLMLVYVAEMLLGWLVYGPWKDPAGFNFPQTITFPASTQVPRLVQGWRLNVGVFVALAAVIAMTLFLFRSLRGFQAQVSGLAPAAASYAGFSARANLWTVLLVSGGLAGLAGALEVAGPIGQLTPHVPAGYGFAAIVVAFVGRLHPVGVVFAAILMSMFVIGGELAQSRMQLPKSVTGVFQGLLLFSLLACDTFIHQRLRRVPRATRHEAGHVNAAFENVARP